MEIEIEMTCAPWSCYAGRRKHRLLVDLTERQVRVWDPIAGYFTRLHSLTPASVRAALCKAQKEVV